MTYQIGDRVRLNKEALARLHEKTEWNDFDAGTITKRREHKKYYGSALHDATEIGYGVRWDGYDYGFDNPENCHTADEVLLLPDGPDEDELAEVLASIEQAARKTMSTRRLP